MKDTKDIAKSIERVIITVVTHRAIVPFFGLLTIALIVWKLDSKDLKEVLLSFSGNNLICLTGWALDVTILFGAIKIFRWREKLYQAELNRLQEVKNSALQKQLKLPLNNPPRDNP